MSEELRAALDSLPFRRMTGEGLDTGGTLGDLAWGWDEWDDVVRKSDVLAALASPPHSEGLDVERLELAMRAAARRYATGPGVDWPEETTPQAEWARVIAAEYARLAKSPQDDA